MHFPWVWMHRGHAGGPYNPSEGLPGVSGRCTCKSDSEGAEFGMHGSHFPTGAMDDPTGLGMH